MELIFFVNLDIAQNRCSSATIDKFINSANRMGAILIGARKMTELFVCAEDEIPEGGVRILKSGATQEIGVYRHRGEFYAYQNRCIHQGGPVCEGELVPRVEDIIDADKQWKGQRFVEDDIHIVCPWHAYEFKLKTGACASDPKLHLKRFEVARREGQIYVIV
jgi:nitrite reductase (NADH) small subunit